MEQSSQPFGLRLSEWLGVTAQRASCILAGAVRWRDGGSVKNERWAVLLGRHMRFSGAIALDDSLKAQVMQMVADRVEVILGADDAALCMLGNGEALPASELRADIGKWLRTNGVECPQCGAELLDWEPDAVLYSDPLQVRTHCVECGHGGYRVFVTPNAAGKRLAEGKSV